MKRQITAAFFTLLFLGSCISLADEAYRTDQVFVRFTAVNGEELTPYQRLRLLSGFVNGSYIARDYKIVPSLCLVQLPEDITVSQAMDTYMRSPLVMYAEPNYKRHFTVIPNDTLFADLWGMNNTGQTGGTVDADIDAPEAWDIHTGDSGNGIVVAVTDTGIDFSHPDLAANMWVNEDEIPGNGIDDDGNGYIDDINGYDFGGATYLDPEDYDNEPNDSMFHGTHVAGTIGAVGNNAMGVTGVCWDVKIMAVKIFPDDIGVTYDDLEILGIEYAVDNGARVINASWGGYGYSQALYDAIEAARDAEVLFVAAAGNEGTNNDGPTPSYPASYDLDNIISVLATDHDDQISYFSNYGHTSVDIGAPGEDILSTFPTYETTDMLLYGYNTDYETISGTSMAAPHVAGAAALGWSFSPGLSYDVVRDAILNTADPLAALDGLCVTGGRLNLLAMLSSLNTRVLNRDTAQMYSRIQEAIDDTSTHSGHTLIVDKGPNFLDKIYYFGVIDFEGKNVILRSGDVDNPLDETIYPERVVISGQGRNTHAVTFSSGENSSAVLKGFTITGGYATGATIWDKSGGGIYCEGSTPTIVDCVITDNHAVRDGGGIHCEDGGDPNIMNCTISNNIGGNDGGGIYCFDSSPLIRNCLIVRNRANRDGGGIYFNGPSPSGEPNVINSTIADNLVNVMDGLGGGIYCYWYVDPDIHYSIISGNPGYAIFEEDTDSDPTVSYCLFYGNPDGDYYDADTLQVKTGAAQINSLPQASDNIDGDPLFVTGKLGDYYLSQTDSGQFDDSPAVDAGDKMASEFGMHLYSTRTNNFPDDGMVDMGFHYNDPYAPVMFTLTTSVSPVGKGSIEPAPGTHSYYQYTHVNLTATASNSDYQFKAWYGTDDDSKKELDEDGIPLDTQDNVVTMDSDKSVLAEFETSLVGLTVTIVTANGTYELSPPPDDARRDLYLRGRKVAITVLPLNPSHRITWSGTDDDTSRQFYNTVTLDEDRDVYVWLEEPQTLIVGGGGIPGAYMDLQEAIFDAQDGDTIVVHAGTWDLIYFDPSQPLPPYGDWVDAGFRLRDKAITIRSTNPDDPDTVAATIIHDRFFIDDVGPDTVLAGLTFTDISFYLISTLANVDCPLAQGSIDGIPAPEEYGGAIRIGYDNFWNIQFPDTYQFYEASPTFVNCVIDDILLGAADGGNGCPCPQESNGGWAGKAYGGGIYVGIGCKPVFKNCIISDCNATGGDGGNACIWGGNAGDPTDPIWYWGPFDEPWRYTGMGGGAFCDVNSEPHFIDCTFQDNVTQGGSTGEAVGLPEEHRRIESFGGAVYCETNSKVKFTNCDFINNMVSTSGFYPLWRWEYGDNAPVVPLDEYIAFGGAAAMSGTMVTFEGMPVDFRNAEVTFENCRFSGSEATNGGALFCQFGYVSDSKVLLDECTFENNTALHGGALYSVNGEIQIVENTFTNNTATGAVGEGGAVFVFDGNIKIADSYITTNEAVASGGGVFVSDSNALLWNCLITENTSGRDGGGVSVNIYSDCNIVNSTIADNVGGNLGGGLYCGYNSYTHIIDSIIWGNFAVDGHQIAIASDDEYYPEPSVVEISYSGVGPEYALGELIEEDGGVGGSAGGTKLIEGQSIYDQIDDTGWAQTVVTLAEPVTLKQTADWDSPEWVEQLRQEVSMRQQAVLSQLTAGEFTLRYRYDNVAAFSGLVTLNGLNKLLLNPQVKHIGPVRHFCKMLRQSIPLANASTARQEYDGSGVAIAIVDTGIDYRHPMLGGGGFPNDKVIGGYDTGEDDEDPIPVGEAHGTCCAGIAAGDLGNIGDYIGGVAFNAKLYALKASPDGLGMFEEDAILAAWDWCLTHRLDDPDNPLLIINNSLGGDVYDNAEDADLAYPAFAVMVENLTEAGVTILAASGNDGYAGVGISAPAALSNVISVGAVYDGTDNPALADEVAGYSNTAQILDILAPADPTYTTDIIGVAGYDAGNYFPAFDGTSAACPFAAGVVASLQSAAIETMGVPLTPAQVKTVLFASGDPVTDTKIAITKPRVNLGNAISSIFAGPIYIGENSQIRYDWWDADTMTWDPDSHNLPVDDDPLFVEGYHLSQIAAGQGVDSHYVDSGSTDAHTANKYRHTTRTDLVVEDLDSLVDRGYHYIRTTEFKGDFNFDGQVDIVDFLTRWLRHYLDVGCEFPDWCHGTDLNMDGTVNNKDYAIYAANFGKKETVPPEPNPMTWEIYPTSEPGADWAEMVATEARDNYGGTITYYIQRTDGGGVPDGHYRDWDPNRMYVNEGLVVDQKYGYRVKARDARGNETGWSAIAYVTVGMQSPPYAPTLLTAVAVSENQINLNWTDNAYDEVGFKIERRTGVNPFAQIATVGANVTAYQDAGLQHSTTYIYRVCAYNGGGDSAYSNEATATTFIVYEPNEPNMIIGDDDPNSTQYIDGNYWYHLVAGEIGDLADGVPLWFRFECTDGAGWQFSSDWIDSTAVFPMVLPHPVNPGFPDVVITLNGTIVSYAVAVKEDGAFGWALHWRICASYNADGSFPSCSEIIVIPPD